MPYSIYYQLPRPPRQSRPSRPSRPPRSPRRAYSNNTGAVHDKVMLVKSLSRARQEPLPTPAREREFAWPKQEIGSGKQKTENRKQDHLSDASLFVPFLAFQPCWASAAISLGMAFSVDVLNLLLILLYSTVLYCTVLYCTHSTLFTLLSSTLLYSRYILSSTLIHYVLGTLLSSPLLSSTLLYSTPQSRRQTLNTPTIH